VHTDHETVSRTERRHVAHLSDFVFLAILLGSPSTELLRDIVFLNELFQLDCRRPCRILFRRRATCKHGGT
jgi:hypothetical protein